MASKCPKCEATISVVNIEPVKLQTLGKATLNGVVYVCQKCQFILSVSVDHVALQKDTLRQIEAVVQKWH
jgi:hypothetical protein